MGRHKPGPLTGSAEDTAAATTPDAATPDAATLDATTVDATTLDAATLDASTPDAATPDAATPDAATPDAATPDAATLDVGPTTALKPCGPGTRLPLRPTSRLGFSSSLHKEAVRGWVPRGNEQKESSTPPA
uniref:Uncharacterized protein n=1 Tax=Molossus molossus TaxID=27622 RepID=A0A7J8I0Q6_MOLMO|nr:hypothetical protein HJG59_010764 [Molossus molossus]